MTCCSMTSSHCTKRWCHIVKCDLNIVANACLRDFPAVTCRRSLV